MTGQSKYQIITTIEDCVRQASEAQEAIRRKNGGTDPPSLRASYDVDPQVFSRLIWCLNTLAENGLLPEYGNRVSQELLDLAGVKPIGEVLGG